MAAAPPSVSIVVPNRDGLEHMQRLLAGLSEHTAYEPQEVIVVDNGSRDGSGEYLQRVRTDFPLTVVANERNESFSDACNQGARLAGGELLLFLNNDTEPFEAGWLAELVEGVHRDGVGIAGPTLIEPPAEPGDRYAVQHRAIRLREEEGVVRPVLDGRGDDPLGPRLGEDATSPIAAGACMLVERGLFDDVGGFTHGYFYGGEDIDLGLKTWERGGAFLCSGRSLLIHRLGSTRTREDAGQRRAIEDDNRRRLLERWGPRVRREFERDRDAGGGFWAVPGNPGASR